MNNLAEQRFGDWFETYTGRAVYPLDPRPEEIALEDIAHALSQACRYSGHCKKFWSVAQHSLMVMEEMKKNGQSPRMQLLGLLHDASEAYLCDIPRPIKPYINQYERWERQLMQAIYKAFEIPLPDQGEMGIINLFDDMVLAAEARIIMPNTDDWASRTSTMQTKTEFDFDVPIGVVKNKFIIAVDNLLIINKY